MSSVSLYRHRGAGNGAWEPWTSQGSYATHAIYYRTGYVHYAAYAVSLSLSAKQAMTGFQIKVNLYNVSSGAGSATVHAYLYTSDPTAEAPTDTIPSGYLAHTSNAVSLASMQGTYQTFTFSGINLTAGTHLYVLFAQPITSEAFLTIAEGPDGASAAAAVHITSGSFGNPACSGTFADISVTVGTPTTSVVDLTGNFPSTYIAGHSKVKVAAAVTTGTGSTISSVKLSYPGGTTVNMSYNSSTGKYEAVTAAPITRNTVFTVTATNSLGFTGTNTVSVTGVVPYTSPSVAINETGTYRCDSSGVKTSGGTHFRVQATANYFSSLSGNTLVKFSVKIKGNSTETNLTSGVQSAAISGMSNTNQGYTIVFTIQDKVSDAVTREYTLEGALRDFVLTRGTDNNGAHIGVGMTPEVVTGRSSIELPSGGRLLVNGEDIVFAPGTYTMTLPCFGDVSNSCKDVDCWFVPPKSLAACSGVSVSGATGCYIRLSTGGYVSSGNADLTSYIRAGVSAIEGGTIRVTFRNAAGWTETNNITIAGVATLTFTLS